MFVMNDPHARDIEKQIDEITDELCKKLSMSEFMVRPVVEETTHKIKG